MYESNEEKSKNYFHLDVNSFLESNNNNNNKRQNTNINRHFEKEFSTDVDKKLTKDELIEEQDQVSSEIDNNLCAKDDIFGKFYRDHKLLLILFRVLGVMPIVKNAPGQMTFSWTSSATIYAILIWSIMSIIVFTIGRERLRILHTTKQFDEYIYAIIFVIYLVPHFWVPFNSWGVATEVAKYKTSWALFQYNYFEVTGGTLQFPGLKFRILVISTGCMLCAVLFLLTLSFLLDGYLLWHTLAYYHIITTINMNCALWYINSRAIKIASYSLAKCFRDDLKNEVSAVVISRYRLLWLKLSELLQSLGNAYARTYSTYCIFIFVNIIIAVYGAFAEIIDNKDESYIISYKEMGLIVDAFYCIILLFVFCDCSHNATLEVANGVQKTLLDTDLSCVDNESKREIDLFTIAIEMNPAIVSLKGYVNVNRELLTSSIATITIYLIVLTQFKFTLERSK